MKAVEPEFHWAKYAPGSQLGVVSYTEAIMERIKQYNQAIDG